MYCTRVMRAIAVVFPAKLRCRSEAMPWRPRQSRTRTSVRSRHTNLPMKSKEKPLRCGLSESSSLLARNLKNSLLYVDASSTIRQKSRSWSMFMRHSIASVCYRRLKSLPRRTTHSELFISMYAKENTTFSKVRHSIRRGFRCVCSAKRTIVRTHLAASWSVVQSKPETLPYVEKRRTECVQ